MKKEKASVPILAAPEEAGHSHKAADYQITHSALEKLLVAFADELGEAKSQDVKATVAKTLEEVAKKFKMDT